MLRDVPRVYMIMFFFAITLVGLSVWYLKVFQNNSNTMDVNEALISSMISEVDESSRLSQGALLLKPSFEKTVYDKIIGNFKEGSVIQFEYFFTDAFKDDEMGQLNANRYNLSTNSTVSDMFDHSRKPSSVFERNGHVVDKPIQSISVKVRKAEDKIAGDNGWTHAGTVDVDAISNPRE